MKSQNKIFKKDLYRKFLIFSILPVLLLSLLFIFLIIKEKNDLILSQHTNIIHNIQYNINIFNQDIQDIPKLLKNTTFDKRKRVLADILKYKNSIDTIMILNQEGIIEDVFSKKEINVFSGYDYSQKLIFKEYLKRKEDFLSNIYFSNLVDTPLISYVFKFSNQIYIVELNLDFINKLVLNLSPSTNSNVSVSIIDRNGLYILDTFSKFNVANRNSFFTTKLFKNNIAKSSEDTLIKYFNESTSMNNYVSYKQIKNLSWMIVLRENQDNIGDYIINYSLIIFFIILCLGSISIIYAKKTANSIVNPIERLTLNINRFSKNYSSKMDNNIKNDYSIFRTLIRDFKKMQHAIIKNEESLKQQIIENKQKDKILSEQSKMVSMGEMIGNIAHQWRQPLSIISTAATGMIMQEEYGKLTNEILIKNCNSINDNAQYLSKTIEDFRNFIKGDRQKKFFSLTDDINSFLHLVEGKLISNNINIILDLDESIKIDGYENELIQCFINIVNNAKDALNENKIEKKFIFLSTFLKDNKVIITIRDNAKGIQEDIVSKIFEPYFTTKHKSQGTGLGLHMTYNLIVDGMNGTIEAKNVKYKYENNEYTGAEFIISLPKS